MLGSLADLNILLHHWTVVNASYDLDQDTKLAEETTTLVENYTVILIYYALSYDWLIAW